MHKHENALIHESSPYLLQHAHNPVNWQPWNEKTLAEAKAKNKMILVSIGYSACHWCHVMEHESFEDETVAAIMNQYFVCIKVDREERPDVDQFFMEAVQLLTGRGGWPLNCFALPDGRPFWGGTYFRKDQWMEVLQQIAALFDREDPAIFEQAEQLTQGIKTNQFKDLKEIVAVNFSDITEKMANKLESQLDYQEGGTRGAPKFPMPDLLRFQLLLKNKNPKVFEHAILSLRKMAKGGIYDQLGGGFSRYAVDGRWHVPHFEKMLYDNAQLIGLYAEAWKLTKEPLFAEVVEQSIQFCERELLGSEGAFMAALDADSEGVEGKFYVWNAAEFEKAVGENAHVMSEFFGINKAALWEDGNNVLVQAFDAATFAREKGLALEEFQNIKSAVRKKLLVKRATRERPATDDKRLLSWNALMINGLVNAATIFERNDWLAKAEKLADFIWDEMRGAYGGLFRSWKNGEAKIAAFLDDYTFLMQAQLTLFQQTGDVMYAEQAKELLHFVLKNFYVEAQHSFAYSDHDSNELPVSTFEQYDNVIPSSNAAMAKVLVELGMLYENQTYTAIAEKMIQQQAEKMTAYPAGFSHWAQALMLLERQQLIVVTGNEALKTAQTLRQHINNLTVVITDESLQLPAVKSKPQQNDLRLYFCDTAGCRPAFNSLTELLAEIKD